MIGIWLYLAGLAVAGYLVYKLAPDNASSPPKPHGR